MCILLLVVGGDRQGANLRCRALLQTMFVELRSRRVLLSVVPGITPVELCSRQTSIIAATELDPLLPVLKHILPVSFPNEAAGLPLRAASRLLHHTKQQDCYCMI
jgi:hypothetical protein